MVPDTAKAAPPLVVSIATHFMGVSLQDWVMLVTIAYTLVLLASKLPRAIAAIKYVIALIRGKPVQEIKIEQESRH